MTNSSGNRLQAIPVFRMIAVLIIAGLLGVFRNFVLPGGMSFTENHNAKSVTKDTLSENLTLKQGYQLFRKGVLFIDARSPERYKNGHIPGALSVPAELTFQEKVERTDSLNTSAEYVVYCNDTECPLAEEVYEFLQIGGFKDIHIMPDGFDGWQAAGYPVKGASGAK